MLKDHNVQWNGWQYIRQYLTLGAKVRETSAMLGVSENTISHDTKTCVLTRLTSLRLQHIEGKRISVDCSVSYWCFYS